MGTLITDTGTWLHGLDIPYVAPGTGHIDLEIDSLNLLPGRYYFSLLLDSSVAQHIYDAMEHAIQLDIEEAPVYGHTRRVDSRFGLVYFPQRWRLEGINGGKRLDPAANA